MRQSETFFAYHNAKDILRGLEFEKLDYISSNLHLSFQLEGFINPHEICLKYGASEIIPQRINILIGKNGLGKSLALNIFIKAALQQREFASCLIDYKNNYGRPMISRIIAIGTLGETSNTFPSDSIKNPKLHYQRLNVTRNSWTKKNQTIGEQLIRLARSKETIRQESRWEIFISSLALALPLDKIVFNTSFGYVSLNKINMYPEEKRLTIWADIEQKKEPMVEVNNSYYSLSSGQLSFFKFALLACLHIENGSFVLLDEPETHLHPNLISSFIHLFDNILEKTGLYGLIATHSAYFVREVNREQVHVFKCSNENEISISNPRLKTFGANAGDISDFVFEDNLINSLSEKVINKVKVKQLTYEKIKEEYRDILPSEMLHHIKFELNG